MHAMRVRVHRDLRGVVQHVPASEILGVLHSNDEMLY